MLNHTIKIMDVIFAWFFLLVITGLLFMNMGFIQNNQEMNATQLQNQEAICRSLIGVECRDADAVPRICERWTK